MAHGAFASLEEQRKNFDAAKRFYRKCIALDPTNPDPYWNVSIILEEQKNDIKVAYENVKKFYDLGGETPIGGDRQRLARLSFEVAKLRAGK